MIVSQHEFFFDWLSMLLPVYFMQMRWVREKEPFDLLLIASPEHCIFYIPGKSISEWASLARVIMVETPNNTILHLHFVFSWYCTIPFKSLGSVPEPPFSDTAIHKVKEEFPIPTIRWVGHLQYPPFNYRLVLRIGHDWLGIDRRSLGRLFQ